MKGSGFSLPKKALLAIVIILLPIFVTFNYLFLKNRDLFERHILEELSVIAETFEVQVFNFLDRSKRRVEDFASDGFISESLRKISKGEASASRSLSEHLLKNKLPLDEHIEAVHVLGLDGRVRASTDPSALELDFSKEPFFTVDGAVSAVETRIDNKPALAVSAPVKDRATGAPSGSLVALIRLSDLDRLLTGEIDREKKRKRWGSGKASLEAYLVNREEFMITGSRFVKESILRTKVAIDPVRSCVKSGEEMNGFYADYRGVAVAGSSRCIDPLGWTLLVELDADEAFAPLSEMRRNIVVAWVIVAGLIALLFIIFYRSVVLQLRKIFDAAKSISGGDYDVRVPVSSGDEIGRISLAFNEMAVDIKTALFALSESEERLNEAQHISRVGSWVWDIANNSLHWSDEIYRIFGLKPQEFGATYEAFLNSVHPDDREFVKESVRKALFEREPYSIDHRVLLLDGTMQKIVHEQAVVSFDEAGHPTRMVGTVQDVTEHRRAEQAIEGIAKFPSENPNPVLRVSEDGIVLYTNAAARPVLAVLGSDIGGRLHDGYASLVGDVYASGKGLEIELASEDRIFSLILTPIRGEKYVNIYGRDITDRKKTEFELKKLSMAMEQSVNVVFITDIKGNIEYVNPMFEQVTGYSKEEAIGQNPRILSSGEVTNQDYESLWKTITAGKTWRNVYKNKKKTGGYYWSNSVISPIKNENGEITNFLAVQEDITEKMVSEERIQYLARYDELTGLVNRTRFIELLDEWIYCAAASGDIGAFYLLDMDDFKFLNDTYGHGAGDEFLRRASRILSAAVGRIRPEKISKEPILGRLSGDEFAVFIPGVAVREALSIAETLRKDIEDFRFQEAPIAITVSIGIVLFPAHGRNAKELFTRADAAMYRAKELGRNRFHLFIPEDQDLEKMHSRVAWKERILKSLRENRFEPWFQPILDLSTNTIHHYESLARLKSEDGSIMLPGAFIDIAERFGLIGSIDRMIIEKSMLMQSRLRKDGKHISFGMNLSGKDLGDDDLLSFLKTKMVETGADPDKLVFEITETAAIGDLDRAIKFIKALKTIGCHFALDDFGVGFTSFTYLREMQVDYIKIDGSFIRKLNVSPNDQVFVKAITDVAKGLKIKSIAEFVENKETLELLKTFGVDFAQGYLIGKPAPPEVAFPAETLTRTPVSRV
ncbi:MAG: EAL domain-containing protein [Deltaproteobacteria bacterium]|nr:EAL domain-containing protein [Deltaproteobacteria bacterium]